MSTMRISGIASGMDTETMVRDLMKAERMRLDKFTQNKILTQWRQEQYNDVNKDFANFIIDMRKELELTTNTSSGITLSNSLTNLGWVKKASSSNEDIFTATATSGSMSGTHKLKVISLAEGVNIASQSEVRVGDSLANNNTTLGELGVSEGDHTIAFKVKTNGDTEEIVEVKYTDETTIGQLIKKINSATAAEDEDISLGLQAKFDSGTGRLFLSTKGTGTMAQIKIATDENGDGIDTGGLFTGENIFKIEADLINGKNGSDAEIEFDGAKGLVYSSNNFTINGIQINLNNIPENPDAEFTLRIDTDVDGVYDKISKFIEKYNELVDKMNGLTSQKRYRDYTPLTNEQKEAMSEDEIKKWEEMAKSGLLKNDEFITRTLDSMRHGLYDEVEGISGKYNQLTTLGIATGEWKDKGKLVIKDEVKLRNAIAEDVDGVLNLLFKQSSITGSDSNLSAEQKEEKRKESGLITRLFDDIVLGMKDIIDKSGTGDNSNLYRSVQSNILIDFVTEMGSISYLDQDIMDVEKALAREESNMARKEESYWRKFTAMEKALQQMNSQSAWLMQQFGGGM